MRRIVWKEIIREVKGAMIYPKPPFEQVNVAKGNLYFGKHSFVMAVRIPRIPKKDVIISYDELYDVSLVPATKWLDGFLCVRKQADKNIPLPRTFLEKSLRDSIILFSQVYNDEFFCVYDFLKQCAIINAKKNTNQQQ